MIKRTTLDIFFFYQISTISSWILVQNVVLEMTLFVDYMTEILWNFFSTVKQGDSGHFSAFQHITVSRFHTKGWTKLY
jgi:hypothetical protein